MLKSIVVGSSPVPMLVEAKDIHGTREPRFGSVVCRSSRNNAYNVPKLEPFSRTKFERAVKDLPLIEKSENDLADYCSTLEGDDSYSCWRAYFELKDLEREAPKEDVEKLILQAGGVKSLIGYLHGISSIHKGKHNEFGLAKSSSAEKEGSRPFHHVPDGLPKSSEQLEEEERGRLPDSPYTRLLRSKGRFPAWYSPVPDHETD
ncbi:CCG-binding protein 1-like [Pistacia vera]|uniref:Uncharacterized protein n=1 Tax=Pistacia integerrima TaxID=434235 RepID=A0ACC0X4Y2_9ROSI|nr:CCG-binding protein 1 [Pistacia vera]XP_031250901.1 CCG-binding protein 1-like [Pistacia vera]KAJ0009868.1 hypothetical protein Pint_34491 [Pistacia integerrima]